MTHHMLYKRAADKVFKRLHFRFYSGGEVSQPRPSARPVAHVALPFL